MDTKALEEKLLLIIKNWYGDDIGEAQGCLDDLLAEMQQYDNNTVTTLICSK